jgi:hypothetical protein
MQAYFILFFLPPPSLLFGNTLLKQRQKKPSAQDLIVTPIAGAILGESRTPAYNEHAQKRFQFF